MQLFSNQTLKKASLILIVLPLLVSAQNKLSRIESVQSVFIEMYSDTINLGSATGFVIRPKEQNYLVTNWHVVTCRNPQNGEWLDPKKPIAPDRIKMHFLSKDHMDLVVVEQPLLDSKKRPLWNENNIGKEKVDVVQLALKDTTNISIFPVNYKTSPYDDVLITPTERIFILGFPLGYRGNQNLPIWKSGLIASEPDFDQEGKPIMWIDAITFHGMSGSPVYFISTGLVNKKDGTSAFISGTGKFMGVFSHAKQAVFGSLWKASYLVPIFDKLP